MDPQLVGATCMGPLMPLLKSAVCLALKRQSSFDAHGCNCNLKRLKSEAGVRPSKRTQGEYESANNSTSVGGATKRLKLDDYRCGPTGRDLLVKLAVGKTSAVEVQKSAANIVQEYKVPSNDLVQGLATLGTKGKYPEHAHRDLLNLMKTSPCKLRPGHIWCTYKNMLEHGTVDVRHSVIWPHE
eukprot:6395039-Karenia_brevis.AAC.1